MTQPTTYNRQTNFTDFQALQPTAPLPADELDAEFNAVKVTLDQTLANLALIQRDDGALVNGIVTQASLASDVLLGVNAPTVWELGEAYVENDTVAHEAIFYICIDDHTATNLNRPDVDDTTWTALIDFTSASFVLAPDDVEEIHILNGAVTEDKIDAGAVTENKIGTGAVSADKLGADAVIAGKIADGAVDVTASLVDGIVTLAKMADLAQSTFIGRAAGAGTGVPTALTATQATAILDAASDTLPGTIELAVQSEMETATDVTRAVTPGRQHFHPGACKCWGFVTVSGGTPTLQTSFNVTSITDTNTGRLTVTIATDMSSVNYPVMVEAGAASTDAEFTYVLHSSKAAGSFEIRHTNNAGTLADPLSWSWCAFGDHA